MKHKVPTQDFALSSITCDRCKQTWQADTVDAAEFTSIDFTGGYGSIFGDGSQIKLDLCQQCVKTVLGLWLHVSDDGGHEDALSRALDAFDPVKHGGEAMADAPVGLERLATDARAAADRSSLAIDAALDAVEPSDKRIEEMESVAQLKGIFGPPDHVMTIEQMQCGVASSGAGTCEGARPIGNVVVGLIERDLNTGQLTGKVIGFPHFEYAGQSAIEVQSKLSRAVKSLVEQGDLVLDSQFVAVVAVGFERLKDAGD